MFTRRIRAEVPDQHDTASKPLQPSLLNSFSSAETSESPPVSPSSDQSVPLKPQWLPRTPAPFPQGPRGLQFEFPSHQTKSVLQGVTNRLTVKTLAAGVRLPGPQSESISARYLSQSGRMQHDRTASGRSSACVDRLDHAVTGTHFNSGNASPPRIILVFQSLPGLQRS